MTKKSGKILTSKEEILQFMEIGEALFRHFMALGLPVVDINGRLYAHSDNLDEWFRKNTSKQQKIEVPDNGKKRKK